MSQPKVAYYTLGCKLNFSETSTIARQLANEGYKKVDFAERADVYIINTCTVTEYADKKCRNAIRRAHRTNPGAIVAVVGCYAQLKPETIAAMPGVDIVLGANEKFDIINYIRQVNKTENTKKAIISASDIHQLNRFFQSYSYADRTRTFFKIQDGCDYLCSYCTIPAARGKSRNRSINETIEAVRKLATTNVQEIVLTGVNIGHFGQSTGESFFDLIKALDEVEDIVRFRISSIEPNLLSNEIIDFVAQSLRFVPHFHIPLQAGSNKILAAMKRRYKRQLYADRVDKIRQVMPYAAIGADVIVGFPGETDDDFMEAYHFINEMSLSYLHVFSFSAREGTEAYKMQNKVSPQIIARRSKMLNTLSEKKRRMFYELNKGKTCRVLFEAGDKRNLMYGFTPNYIKAGVPYNENLINKIADVELKNINKEGFFNAGLVNQTNK